MSIWPATLHKHCTLRAYFQKIKVHMFASPNLKQARQYCY